MPSASSAVTTGGRRRSAIRQMKAGIPVGLGSVYAVCTISYGTHLGVPVNSSRPSIHKMGASG